MFKDLTGKTIGRWTVLYRTDDHITKGGNVFTMWMCRCACGIEKPVYANSLLSGKSISCGCNQSEIARKTCGDMFRTHGDSKSRLYHIWAGIKKRCYNPQSSNYQNYGGRGITMCDEWKEDYACFQTWALTNGYDDGLSIDRIDVNGDYSPDNCRWVDQKAQSNNRRNNVRIMYNGELHTIAECAELTGISYASLHKQLSKGKTIEEIISA